MMMHVHDVAGNISVNGTSARRYGKVKLVEVPESVRKEVLKANQTKAAANPLLAKFKLEAMSHTNKLYANINCTHFCEAHKVIGEGGRRFRDKPEGLPLQLQPDDTEGHNIQEQGVNAIAYGEKLWNDRHALFALMREDNRFANLCK